MTYMDMDGTEKKTDQLLVPLTVARNIKQLEEAMGGNLKKVTVFTAGNGINMRYSVVPKQ